MATVSLLPCKIRWGINSHPGIDGTDLSSARGRAWPQCRTELPVHYGADWFHSCLQGKVEHNYLQRGRGAPSMYQYAGSIDGTDISSAPGASLATAPHGSPQNIMEPTSFSSCHQGQVDFSRLQRGCDVQSMYLYTTGSLYTRTSQSAMYT